MIIFSVFHHFIIPALKCTGSAVCSQGSKAVLLRGVKPQWILKAVSEEKVTIVWLLVPWAQDILDAIESGELKIQDYDLGQWRLMHIGAQPVPPSLIPPLETLFSGAPV